MDGTTTEKKWLALGRKTMRQVNLAWYIECLRVPVVASSLVACVMIVLLRQSHVQIDQDRVIWILLGLLCGVLTWVYWLARKRFTDLDETMVRLDASLHTNSRLSAARAGYSEWPDLPETQENGLNWNKARCVYPVIGAFFLVGLSLSIPVGEIGDKNYQTTAPKAYEDLVNSIEELDQHDVVEEEYIEEIKEKIDLLDQQNSEDWFSHTSLEAIDSLKASHEHNAAKLEQSLRKAEHALQSLDHAAAQLSQEAKQRLMSDYGEALENMDKGAMKLNEDLLEQLKGLDLREISGVDKEKLKAMRERMKASAEQLKKQKGEGIGPEPKEMADGSEGSQGEQGGDDGKGGITRGPGHVPGVLGDEIPPLETGDLEGIDPKSLDGMTPGDLLGTRETEHDIDEKIHPRQDGGGVKSQSLGGDRVWKNSLMPGEQRALKQFFK